MIDIILAGGGHGHITILKELIKKPIEGVNISLITDNKFQYYSGMLSGFIEGIYTHDEISFDVETLCKKAKVNFILEEIESIDSLSRILKTKNNEYSFDILSMNLGSKSTDNFIIKNDNESFTKPISNLVDFYNNLLNKDLEGKRLLIVGGGASGSELAISFKVKFPKLSVSLIQKSNKLIPEYNERSISLLNKRLKNFNIHVITGNKIDKIDNNHIYSTCNNLDLPYDFLILSNGYTGVSINYKNMEVDENNFVVVDSKLMANCNILAMGDMIKLSQYPKLPKAGVFAIRQAPILKNNLLFLIKEELNKNKKVDGKEESKDVLNNNLELMEYVPQTKYMQILNTGNRTALINYGKYSMLSKLAFIVKDYIDRKYMNL